MKIIGGVLALAVVLGLASQWKFETAAFSEVAGFRSVVQVRALSGLSLELQAAQNWPYEPQYREDVANLYLRLAVSAGPSAEPSYHTSDNDAITIYPSRAISLGRNQLFQLSVGALHGAQSLTPLDPDVYDRLGNTYLQWKRPAQAVSAFRQAESLSLNNPKYLAEESLALLEARQPSRALKFAQAALNLDRSYWYSYFALARVYHDLNQKSLAREAASRAIFWVPVAYPPPPSTQLSDLQTLQRTG